MCRYSYDIDTCAAAITAVESTICCQQRRTTTKDISVEAQCGRNYGKLC